MSLWSAPARSEMAQRLYLEAEADRKARPERYDLGASVIAEAVRLRDPEASVPEGISRLADDAKESGRLNAIGRLAIRRLLISLSLKRNQLARCLAEHPAAEQVSIVAPIVIVGGWRTGSTLLHRALAAGPLRGVAFWEWAAPWVAAGGDARAQEQVIKGAQAGFAYQYTLNPLKQRVHGAAATWAEECVVGMGGTGCNWALLSSVRAPKYAAWLAGQDFREEYVWHRRMLQAIALSNPNRRFVLKAPAHTAELRALLSVYPDAHVVHLHREGASAAAAAAHLFAVFRSTYSDDVDPAEVGREQSAATRLWSDRAAKARKNSALAGAKFLDVDFTELVGDPLGCANRVLRWADVAVNDGEQDAMQRHLAENGEAGGYRYRPEEFGLT